MLVAIDIFRSIWLIVFPLVTFTKGTVPTRTGFCQASGYFIQMSFEMTDFTALLIAVQTAIQVFRPKPRIIEQGGLHSYRHYIYVSILLIPAVLAAIAFAKGNFAYLSQGPLCSLPIRPFWYRLATSWIPRYVIILVILLLYVAIYVHAEHQFGDSRLFRGKLLAAMRRLSDSRRKSRVASGAVNLNQQSTHSTSKDHGYHPHIPPGTQSRRRSSSVKHQSRGSLPTIDVDSTRHTSSATASTNQPLILGANKQGAQSIPAINWQVDGPHDSDPPSAIRSRGNSYPEQENLSLTSSGVDTRFEIEEMRTKHKAIRKQLRLLFVYPVVYFLVWVGPFVQHGTLYNYSMAAHPVFGLALWAYVSYAVLGFLNALVFSLRERPWRHIPGNDGSLTGSFLFWQHASTSTPRDRSCSSGSRDTTARRGSLQAVSLSRSRLSAHMRSDQLQEPLERALTTLSTTPRPNEDNDRRNEDAGLRQLASWDFRQSNTDGERSV